MELISITKLLDENPKISNSEIEEALISNWDNYHKLFSDEDYNLNLVDELMDFIYDKKVVYFDIYKQYTTLNIILKIKNRYFSCEWWHTNWGECGCEECKEVFPTLTMHYEVKYNDEKANAPAVIIDDNYKEFSILKNETKNAYESFLTEIFNAGRESYATAITDYVVYTGSAYINLDAFNIWYEHNNNKYGAKFKVTGE